MKRIVWAGIAAFLLALIVVLPVRWFTGWLPPQLHCKQWSGSVWHGQCAGLTVEQPGAAPLQASVLRWKLQPLALLGLAVHASFEVQTPLGSGKGRLEMGRNGRIALRDVSLTAAFDSRLVTLVPDGWSGRLEGRQISLRMQGNQVQALSGQLALHDFSDGSGNNFGSYRLEFPPALAPPFAGQLKDIDGPLEVAASLTVTAERRWSLDGSITPRAGAAIALRRELEGLGGPDSRGGYPLRAEGSFK